MAFNYTYKPVDYKTAQGQAAKQVDPLFNRAIQGVQQQKYQSDVQAGQVAAARGLGHSGLAADQLNKIAIAAQGQVGDLNAQRATQIATQANDLVWRDKEFALQDRSQKYNEFNSDRGFNYQTGRDKVADTQWNNQFNYQKGRDKVSDTQWNSQYNHQLSRDKVADQQWADQFTYQKGRDSMDDKWRKYQFDNMSASDKAQLAWSKQQYGEDAAWRMYEMKYQGEIAKEGF